VTAGDRNPAPRVLVVRHDESVPPGRLTRTLDGFGHEVRLDLGESLPDPSEWDGIVVLGGPLGAYDVDRFSFLEDEKRFLRAAVDRSIPVLGICLGCQLLADALGGSAYLAPQIEAHFAPCEMSAEGAADPVARHLAGPVLSLHQDSWVLPPGATLLASSERYPQAFRMGSALGIQPHPEAGPGLAEAWIDHLGRDRLTATGVDPDALLADMRAGEDAADGLADALFGDWLSRL